MSENEPHVSTDELRAALAPRGESRRNPVLVSDQSEHAATELAELRAALDASRGDASELRTALDAARADAIELRAALDATRGDASELRAELATVKAESRERRLGLEKLASAGFFRRRGVLADLDARGVL
jgi:septal ring factor EnvC (AmiA/AmiB activator)